MFSLLSNLMRLDLRWNSCIDKEFESNLSKAMIEQELAECGAEYALHEQNLEKTRSDQTGKLNHDQETCKRKISEKLENLQNSVDQKMGR
jgi:hypothetical protein